MVSVIVPTYEESQNIWELITLTLKEFGKLDEPAEILVVDDNSPDGTAAEVRKIAGALNETSRVRVLVRSCDRGLAKAVQAGISDARGDILVVMDADLSHPPGLLPDLIAQIRQGGASCAVASRYVRGGGTEGWPLRRRLISRGAGLLARPLVGIQDATSGFMAFRRSCVEGIQLVPRGYKIALEILVRGRVDSIAEVPFVFRDRERGKSKLAGQVIIAYLWQLAALYRYRFPLAVRYVQFCLVGLLGAGLDFGVFQGAYYGIGLERLGSATGGFVAQTASFLATVGFSYALNTAWTFRERAESRRFTLFAATCTVGFLVRSIAFEAVVLTCGPLLASLAVPWRPERLALFAGIVVASVWNFLGSNRWAFPHPASDRSRSRKPTDTEHRVLWFLLALTVLRLAFAAATSLAPDEAYYWQWSRHLALGYFDHPPMVAYEIALGTRLLGDTQIGVRFVTVLLSSGTAWLIFVLASDVWDSVGAGLWALGATLVTPLFAAGALLATPDTPLVFFWTAAVALSVRAFRSESCLDWSFTGVALGLAMLSKYPAVLLAPALLAALLTTTTGRRALRTRGPWLGLGVAFLLCLPLAAWHLSQGYGPILFQLRHGLGPAAGSRRAATGLKTFTEFVLGQAAVLTPWIFGLVIWAVALACRRLWRGAQSREDLPLRYLEALPLLLFPAVFTFATFALASCLARSEPNWPAAVYPTALVLLGGELDRRLRGPSAGARRLAMIALISAATVTVYAQVELTFPLAAYRNGPVSKVHDRSEVVRWAERLRMGRNPAAPVLAESYQLASLLAFYLPDHPQTDSPLESGSGSAYLAWRHKDFTQGDAWFFTTDSTRKDPDRLFERYDYIGACDDVRRGVSLDTWTAYYGRMRPLPPPRPLKESS